MLNPLLKLLGRGRRVGSLGHVSGRFQRPTFLSSKTDLFCIAIPAGWLAAPCCRHTVFYGPTELDAKHVITLLQYLNHTRKVKLVFRRDHHPISSHIKSYADKDKDLLDLVWANQGPDIVGDQLMGMTDADYASKLEKDLKATSAAIS